MLAALCCAAVPHRYMDEVRKVIKTCYEEVWTILQEHRCGARLPLPEAICLVCAAACSFAALKTKYVL